MRGPGCAPGESGPSAVDERLDELMTVTHHSVGTHITSDHALSQTWLKRLVDDTTILFDIALAPERELPQ
jgi:hypothetical protein